MSTLEISSSVTYRYRAYGLMFVSETLFPGVLREPSDLDQPHMALNLGPEPEWVRRAIRSPSCVTYPKPGATERDEAGFTLTSFGADEFFQLAYRDGTRFVLDPSAGTLWGTYSAPLAVEDLTTYLLGPVLGFVLRRRGVLSLHASSVGVGGQAVVLCGASGAGKSTTAAALALRGFPVLAEDISPIHQEGDGTPSVVPGYPRICLWPDTVEELLGSPEALPQLTPTWEKRFLPLDDGRARFESRRHPLGAVYVLAPRVEDADAPRIEDLDKREALIELVQNTYMNWLLDRTQRAAELDALARIVARVPVRRIVPHRDPARVGALCDLIVTDAERLFAGRDSAPLLPTR